MLDSIRSRLLRSTKVNADIAVENAGRQALMPVAPEPRAVPADGGRVTRLELFLLFGLFASFRFFAVPFFKPGGEIYGGAHDYYFYLDMAELSLEGFYPYIDFWLEYPPVFPWVLVALYKLSLTLPSWPNSIMWFQVTVSTFLLLFELGNLYLIYRIVETIEGPRVALRAGWLYAGLFYPLYVLTNWFDTLPLFFILLGIYATIKGRPVVAGLAVGVGFMTKLIPAFVAPLVVLALRRWRERFVFVAVAAGVVVAIALPFVLGDPTMSIASARSMVERSSWLTVWALLEGYYGVGNMPAWYQRFVPQSADWQLHPESLPWIWINSAAVLSFVALYSRRLDWREPRVIAAAAALSFNLLLFFSKGWSPQFLIYVLALLVINLPTARGLTYAVLLTLNNFLEWPVAGIFFKGDPGVISVAVVVRTTLLLLLSWEYVTILYPRLRSGWVAVGRALIVPVASALTVLALAGGWVLLDQYVKATPQQPVAAYISARSLPGQSLLASSREAFYSLKPLFPADRFFLVREDIWRSNAAIAGALQRLTEDSPQTWVVLDYGNGEPRPTGAILSWLDSWGSRTVDVWFKDYRLVGYVAITTERPVSGLGAGGSAAPPRPGGP